MKSRSRTPLTALCATAALLAVPAAASAASGTVSVKVPSCSKSSTATVTVTAKPSAGNGVVVIAATNGPELLQNSKMYFFKSFPPPSPANRRTASASASGTRSVSGKVPVGKKIYAAAGFANLVPGPNPGNGLVMKPFTVKKCAAFTG